MANGCYINEDGMYYEGDQGAPWHQQVPQRPSINHKFDDASGKWIEDQEKLDVVKKIDAKIALDKLDLKSIRAIREFLAIQFPDYKWIDCDGKETSLPELEAKAESERAKLR